jgi:hypothetical protein
MSTAYDTDVVAWSEEQAALLRAGKLSSLDIEHIADELEDVGKSEKWSAQPERRGASWRGTIKEQRAEVADVLDDAPSLRLRLVDDAWMERTWNRAVGRAMTETELDAFPETCPWTIDQVLDANFLPD